jgi:lipopolysaccharide biosynthesis glycosyltransferase
MIQIGIGTQANQYIGQKVLEYTIRKHTKEAVDIRYPKQIAKHKGGTKFGFVRFQLPELFGFKGRAIYMDADQLVFADVRELVDSLDSDHAIGIVRNIHGTFAGKPVAERNETSVMVLDCEKLVNWKTDTIFENVVPNSAELQPGQIHYLDFMRLGWVDQALIQPIDNRWNHYNVIDEQTKLVHFSHVRDQPWKRPSHPYTGEWVKWMLEAKEHGFVTTGDMLKSVGLLHIHPHFARYAFQ